jgi:general secretion pathway protein F/type IV pilus assembly protein PilC
MPTFQYKARDPGGQAVTGTLVADTPAGAARMLDDQSLMPVEVAELKSVNPLGGKRRISMGKIGLFYEQLADLLKAGVPMLRALKVLSHQSSNPALSRVLREVQEDVAGGDTLADAFEKHPYAFPKIQVGMIRAGEAGGFLEDVMLRLSEFVSRQDALRNKFIGSMIYPTVLLTVGFGAVVGLMVFVVPRIRDFLEAKSLPTITKVVFATSDFIGQFYLPIAVVVAVVTVALVAFARSELGRDVWARVQLKTPGIGRIYTMISLCRFCRIFGTLLQNGIPVLQALRIARESTGNAILSEMIEEAAEAVGGGESLAKPLSEGGLFPLAVIDMIAVAEESNNLEKVLIEIADTQEERTNRQIDLFVKLLEPFLLLLMGVMVLVIAVALLLPILSMATTGIR